MAAYRRVHDSCNLQADCEEPGSAPEPALEYGRPLPSFYRRKQRAMWPFAAFWARLVRISCSLLFTSRNGNV